MKLLPTFSGHSDNRKVAGFTIIELVIVIALIGILAGFILAVIDPITQFKKANDGRRKADLAQIQRSLEQYYQDNRQYPAHSAGYKIVGLNGQPVEWGSPFSPYMNLVPEDPSSAKAYIYYAANAGQSYWIYASLERADKDSHACNEGNACDTVATNGISAVACGGTCNYGVSSANVSP